LEFLDLLLGLADERLFIFKLGSEGSDFLVLPLDGLLQFLLVPFEVGDGFLGELKVSLYLPLGLLNVTTETLPGLELKLMIYGEGG
jgi:hypothetical protein